jgi:hypothetical protein
MNAYCFLIDETEVMRNVSRVVLVLVIGAAPLSIVGCSDSSDAQCVRLAGSKICYVRDNPAAGTIEVSGLRPGSTLTITSQQFGTSTYPVNEAGTLNGKAGFINGIGTSVELTVTGTTDSNEVLVGTFHS